MLWSWLYLGGALIGLWFTWQALRPVPMPKIHAIPSFFAGWLTNELVLHHYVWQAVMSGVFIWQGALGAWPGWVAVGVTLAQWVLMVGIVRDAFAARDAIERGVVDALGADYAAGLPDPGDGPDWYQPQWRSVLLPIPLRSPRVSVRRNVVYGRASGKDLRLDVFAPETAGTGRPVIVYVHGGGWVLGFRDRQGVPLLSELAERGWIGVRPAYRLSPVATYPDHLIDVKRAIAWVRENAEELGADPDFVVVSGGSAGGHLAALAALTAGNRDLQPGFEAADTSVAACVPIYGVYDPRNDLGHHDDDFARFFTEIVVKADPHEDPDRWALASAFEQIHPGAPPFLIVHGERDSLTSAQEAGVFASKLEEQTHAEVGFALLPGAQHAFDVFPSVRTAFVVRGVARFLTVLHSRRHARAVTTHDREDDR